MYDYARNTWRDRLFTFENRNFEEKFIFIKNYSLKFFSCAKRDLLISERKTLINNKKLNWHTENTEK